MARLPGQASAIALIWSGFWTVLALTIIIVGHLVWVFIIYGMFNHSDALKELESFLPMFSQIQMYILAGLAIMMDIWILVSHRKERTKHRQH